MHDKLQALDPRKFENLIFDLAQQLGLENLVWRTPGPDGGRDIEGELQVSDLSGGTARQRWFLECKRHDAALSWPIVWEKIAFAQNEDVDFLLIVTTSNPSPNCESEIQKWNARRRRPIVRSWRGYELEGLLLRFPAVLVKYQLAENEEARSQAFMPLAVDVAKFSQSAYSASELGIDSGHFLEAAAALAELLSVRMRDVSIHGQILSSSFQAPIDRYTWLESCPALADFDRFGVRALASVLRAGLRSTSVSVYKTPAGIRLNASDAKYNLVKSICDVLKRSGFWASMEVTALPGDTGCTISARNEGIE